MDFSKPIYGEVEGFVDVDAAAAKAYFKNHGILNIRSRRKTAMTEEQLKEANKNTEVTFCQ